MRHKVDGRKFDMPTDQRMAMLRNLTTDVLKHGSVRTTEARAKEARRFVDRMVTLGKRGTLHARRQALAFVYDPTWSRTCSRRSRRSTPTGRVATPACRSWAVAAAMAQPWRSWSWCRRR